MSDATREAQLIALTAKALRPIAADLGITGTSRMVKADIVAAILKAEGVAALLAIGEVHRPTRVDFEMSKSYDRVIDRDAAHAEALEIVSTEDAMRKANDELTRAALRDQLSPKLERDHAAAIVLDQDREIYRWVTNLSDAQIAAPTDWSAVAAYAEERRPHFTEEQWAKLAGKAADDNVIEYPGKVIDSPKPLPTAVRRTRHGVETVVIEDVREGRVHFRNVENGRLSAPYTMREASFAARYTPVSR